MKRILVVDDAVGPRESLKLILGRTYGVLLAETVERARQILDRELVDLVLLDVRVAGKDEPGFLKELRGRYPHIPVVLLSASMTVRPAMEGLREGACGYLTKPFDVDGVQFLLRQIMENQSLRRRTRALETDLSREFPVAEVVGQAPAFRASLAALRKLAGSDAPVLIQGDPGTGRELAARMVHALSGRREEPFVAVRGMASDASSLDGDLFGCGKRESEGTDQHPAGLLGLAGAGTLFFAEIADLPLATQDKLLRMLQAGEFTWGGDAHVLRTRVRILAASARDLQDAARSGHFRSDLLDRLGATTVRMPPLRERLGDVRLLARHFLGGLRRTLGAATEDFTPAALALMEWYKWPGNVRELRNAVERMLLLHGQERRFTPHHLPPEVRGLNEDPPTSQEGDCSLATMVGSYERTLIEKALRDAGGVQTRAAKGLGTTRRILRYKMQQLNIPIAGSDSGGAA
jgi:DNA-binding NtrC family response regulator